MRAVVGPWPNDEEHELRDWQDEFGQQIRRHDLPDFSLEACPGAGKTKAALSVAREWLEEGRHERAVVVVGTENLKHQWCEAAHRCGVSLDPEFVNRDGREAGDYHGVAVTYAQVASNPDVFRAGCRRRTLVIFDEIHHVGKQLAWADAIVRAFSPAAFRLCLTGTPFRTDGREIPFVPTRRGTDGVLRSRGDYRYTYADALRDGVCREVVFPNYDGLVQWERAGEAHDGLLTDECDDRGERDRLRMAIDPRGDWLPGILREADERLTQVRDAGHLKAGGLVVAANQPHARAIADLLRLRSGEAPAIAISDDPEASAAIARFRTSSTRWLVAVRMVSEGVDIKRLRVGVYATDVLTELHLRQVVGRFCRHDPALEAEDQEGCLYLPAIPTLTSWAARIKREAEQAFRELREKVALELEQEERERRAGTPSYAEFMGADAPVQRGVIFDGHDVWVAELQRAEAFARKAGITGRIRPELLAAALREYVAGPTATGVVAPPVPPDRPVRTVKRQKDEQRRLLQKLVIRSVFRLFPGITSRDGEFKRHCSIAYNRLAEQTGGGPVATAPLESLRARVRLMNQALGEAVDDLG